jgi:hypothetical protein
LDDPFLDLGAPAIEIAKEPIDLGQLAEKLRWRGAAPFPVLHPLGIELPGSVVQALDASPQSVLNSGQLQHAFLASLEGVDFQQR